MTTAVASSRLVERFREKFPQSAARQARAQALFPNGVTHDLRHLEPFPIYIDRAAGCRKWAVDGHELIDYWCGHGALLLGHSHPAVVDAVQTQMSRATHPGGCHDLEIEWGELVRQLIPCAEAMRFTGSGTEATLMALRLSRIYTGRPKLLKFLGHFHGWHDFVAPGSDPPYDGSLPLGILPQVAACTVTIPPNDLELLEKTLATDPEIGAVILEPTGGHWGAVPIRQPFLQGVRELTRRYGQVLIFDEVITGFRVHPRGVQGLHGITPDLTTLAKVLAGGLPGGCLVGREEILSTISFRPGRPKMRHPGTFNGNPLSAAAGVAALKQVATGEPSRQANAMGRLLRNRLNRLFVEQGLPWVAYTDFSMFRLIPHYTGPKIDPIEASGDDNGFIPYGGDIHQLEAPKPTKLVHSFRQAMLLQGVDLPGLGGWLSCMHTEADIEHTVAAVQTALCWLGEEGIL